MKYLYILLLIALSSILICCNRNNSNVNNYDNYLKLSENEKLELCNEQIKKREIIISTKHNISIPENSIFYIITDNKILDSLGFKSFIEPPIIVRFSDREVNYSGNRFEDGGLSNKNVGRNYNLGSYAGKGLTRDIQIYHTDLEENSFVPWGLGFKMNNLGKYEVYDFGEMEVIPGIPGYLNGLWSFLEYLGDFADQISLKKIDLNRKDFLFYYNGQFNSKFNGIYLRAKGISNVQHDNNWKDYFKQLETSFKNENDFIKLCVEVFKNEESPLEWWKSAKAGTSFSTLQKTLTQLPITEVDSITKIIEVPENNCQLEFKLIDRNWKLNDVTYWVD